MAQIIFFTQKKGINKERVKDMYKNKKRVLACILLITCFLSLISCSFSKPVSENKSEIAIQKTSNGFYNIKDGEKLYEDLEIVNSCNGSFGESGRIKSAEIYKPVNLSPYQYIPILIVMYNETPLLFYLEECYTYNPTVYLYDIDGDGEDEIIVDSLRAASSRVETVLFILKVVEGKLEVLYRFPEYTYDYSKGNIPYEILDFGFTSQLLNNYKLKVEFPATGFSKTFDISSLSKKGLLYNLKGKLLPDAKTENIIYFGCFVLSDLQDVDEDGIYEIIGQQIAGMFGEENLGNTEVVLKYNTQKKQMEVLKIKFEVNT